MSGEAGAGGTPAPRVVAIDGPAGAGKSSVARRLARLLDLPFVDTGAMYRAAAVHFGALGLDPDDELAVATAVPGLPLALVRGPGGAEVRLAGEPVGERIRDPEIADLTSRLARHAALRRLMVELQREFVAAHGGVIEGRDIGTVVAPETPFKFFLDASPATRAARRHAELVAKGGEQKADEVARQLAERDARDASRESSPLIAAPDALRVSSDGLSVDEVVDRLRVAIERRSVG